MVEPEPDFSFADERIKTCYSERAIDIFKERYCLKGETISQAMWRVAINVSKTSREKALEYFNMLLVPNRFIPNTPTWTGSGTRLNQLAACFVLPIDDDMESIFNTLRDAALIQRSGGGVGFNFGHLRPANSLVKSSGGKSSGPISFLTAYDAVFQTIAQGGSRRGACMGVLPVDHPDIISFIRCKKQEGKISNFNLSVSITDEFMHSVIDGGICKLKDPETGEIIKEIPAAELFSEIIENTWTNGEPGVLFIDTINKHNPSPVDLKIEATNPCVTGDSIVHTLEGARCVKDLIGVPFRTAEGDLVPGGFFATRNTTELIKITTANGYSITCTPNHRLHTVFGWEEAKDIKPEDDTLLMMYGSNIDKEQEISIDSNREKELAQVGFALASGSYGMDNPALVKPVTNLSEVYCKYEVDTANVATSTCIIRNCWMYSGRPESKLVIGSCSEATAQSVHLALLRMGLITSMRSLETFWEFVPITRHTVQFQCMICCDRDLKDAIKVSTHNARKVFTLHRTDRDVVKSVEQITLSEPITVYDATCKDPTDHVLHIDGFINHNCGEIPLSSGESCCLGSINLRNHTSESGVVDWSLLRYTVDTAVKFLNDVIDANGFVPAVPKLKETALYTRRIGLGIMGLADMFFRMGIRYGSMESISVASQVMEFIRYCAMNASMFLAANDGVFPAFSKSKFADDTWVTPKKLDTEKLFGEPFVHVDIGMPPIDWDYIHRAIKIHGIRNIATVAVAPTGTLSLASGVSGFGCEPVFGLVHRRRIISRHDGQVRYQTMMVPELNMALRDNELTDEQIEVAIEKIKSTGSCKNVENVPESVSNVFVCAADVTVKQHVMMQAALQCFVDGAISKTVNMPPGSTRDDVRETFLSAWTAGCKGICVYIAGSRETEVLSTGKK